MSNTLFTVTLIEGIIPLGGALTFHYLFSSTYVINYEYCFLGIL
jgi:hypothetical protein